TTARLSDGNRAVRLAQYGLLGIGGIRLVRALGIEPAVVHMNEGHPGLAALELAAEQVELGASLDEGLAAARERVVFTTHTPVAAQRHLGEAWGEGEAVDRQTWERVQAIPNEELWTARCFAR